MGELKNLTAQNPLLFALVLTRISSMLIAMPGIGIGVPTRVRAALAVLLSLVTLSTLANSDAAGPTTAVHPIDFAMLLTHEVIIGLLIGTTVQIAVTGVQSAGEIISGTGGMGLASAIDPTTHAPMPTMAQLVGLLVVATLMAGGGHRLVIAALLDSFIAMPPGGARLAEPMLDLLISQLTDSLASGLRVAAPVLLALLLSNLVTGLISRTLPQLNVLAIGLSLNTLALLAVAALTIGSAGHLFQAELEAMIQRFSSVWPAH